MEPLITAMLKLKTLFGTKYIRIWIVLFLLSAFLCFAPVDIKKTLVLDSFCHSYQTYISLVFSFCLIYVFLHLVIEILKILKNSWENEKASQVQKRDFNSLSLKEKKVIVEYISSGESVRELRYENPTIISLQEKGILVPCTIQGKKQGNIYLRPFKMSSWAIKLAEKHKNSLEKECNNDL